MYSNATWTTARAFWIKLANTLRLRLLLHYSTKNPAFAVTEMTNLINTTGITFMSSNADNFQVNFFNVINQRNPISAFEVSRANYLFADRFMTEMMDAKNDPRRPFYFSIFPLSFTPFNVTTNASSSADSLVFPYTNTIQVGMTVEATGIPNYTIVKSVTHTPSTNPTKTKIIVNDDETLGYAIASIPSGSSITFKPVYRGVSAIKPPIAANNFYSRIHTFLRGAVTTPAVGTNSGVYSGAAPQRILPYSEYCFIRAEAALMGAPGNVQQWFSDGITASMQEAGVTAGNITTYLAANGTLTGTNAQKLQQIIEEKYIALFGVAVEPWNDWRRTGFPAIIPPTNRLSSVTAVPRSLFYPQSEIDYNPNNPGQKSVDLQSKVFWDN